MITSVAAPPRFLHHIHHSCHYLHTAPDLIEHRRLTQECCHLHFLPHVVRALSSAACFAAAGEKWLQGSVGTQQKPAANGGWFQGFHQTEGSSRSSVGPWFRNEPSAAASGAPVAPVVRETSPSRERFLSKMQARTGSPGASRRTRNRQVGAALLTHRHTAPGQQHAAITQGRKRDIRKGWRVRHRKSKTRARESEWVEAENKRGCLF